jgi:hypothetical protein
MYGFEASFLIEKTPKTAYIFHISHKKSRPAQGRLAERAGFEPAVPLPVHTLSRRANSTTLAPFRSGKYTPI